MTVLTFMCRFIRRKKQPSDIHHSSGLKPGLGLPMLLKRLCCTRSRPDIVMCVMRFRTFGLQRQNEINPNYDRLIQQESIVTRVPARMPSRNPAFPEIKYFSPPKSPHGQWDTTQPRLRFIPALPKPDWIISTCKLHLHPFHWRIE